MKGFKGFDKYFKCNNFQYKEGKTFKHEGDIKLCNKGFHFCTHPLDVLGYYNSRFAEVDADNVDPQKDSDTKRVCDTIHIKEEITLKALIDLAVKFVFDKADWSKKETQATRYRGAASATGDSGAASATGDSGVASAGDMGAASATGYRGAASATGYRGAASATGDSGAASATGKHSVACGLGIDCQAQGALGCWLVLAEREVVNNKWVIKTIKTVNVDGKKIKAMTWYTLKNSKFVEVK